MVATMSQGQTKGNLLFYVEQDYSFDILRPLQAKALQRGYDVRWLVVGDASPEILKPDSHRLVSISEAIDYRPVAVFAPGDRIPGFIPGLKVQVFHGINEDKRGTSYPERGLFDLYCTEGPTRTAMLAPLAEQRGYFRVAETGWLKLDTILNQPTTQKTTDRPQIVFASTFTPRLSGAEALLPEIKRLAQSSKWQWLITLHPKMSPATVNKYQALQNENLSFYPAEKTTYILQLADIMVSDNSSILQEFLLLKKPVVTFRNRAPRPCMININEPEQLEPAILRALNPEPALLTEIEHYGPAITPYLDGSSADRVLDATEAMLAENWQDKKPANRMRNFKIRRQLNHYKFW
jgi:CDP-glycerol glycerophosphotransferase (TagB/SpsB family)